MSEVPAGWDRKRLRNVATVQTGLAKGKPTTKDSVTLPYLRVANVQDGYLDLSEIKYISVPRKDVSRYSLREGDVLLTEGGDFDKLGRGHIWRSEITQCLHQNHIFVVRVNRAKLIPEFFSTLAASGYGKRYFLSCAKQTTNLASINSTQLKAFPVLVPPLAEQWRIAEILGTWDEAIALVERRIAAARQRKQGLMQRLLTGQVRFPGFTGAWREVRLGDLGETFNGLTGKSKEDFGQGKPYVPYLNIYNNAVLDPGQMDYVAVGPNERQNRVRCGDIFFTTSSETPDEVGMAAVLLDEIGEAYLNSFCYGFRLTDFSQLVPGYAAYLLRGDDFRHAMYYLAQGATRFNLTKRYLLAAPLRLPPIAEQRKIASILATCDDEIDLLARTLAALQQQKKGLMQRLLTGRVRV